MRLQADPGDDFDFLLAWLQPTSLSRQCQDFLSFFIKLQNKPKKVWNKIRNGDTNICKSFCKVKSPDRSLYRLNLCKKAKTFRLTEIELSQKNSLLVRVLFLRAINSFWLRPRVAACPRWDLTYNYRKAKGREFDFVTMKILDFFRKIV